MPDDQQQPSAEELEELARRYVDLWQDQMTALAADPEFAESLQKVMAAMGLAASGVPALWSAWPTALAGMMAAAQTPAQRGEAAGEPASDRRAASAAGAPRGAPGPAPAAAAPAGGGADLGILQERLAALEERVRELEGGARRPRRSAKPKSGRS